ncbi:Aminotransferase-like, plant mobile domain [Dillenia turbinata]|uniref:Serine/threonine-protein phosphatase n=1 Tax=Dillenia turbinata TaxID=194707 RepID=A0AAN8UIT3_9MAGN
MDPLLYNPGPVDYSVLYEQDKHISSAIWDGEDRGVLRCHDRTVKVGEWTLNKTQIELVERAGFGHLRSISSTWIDKPLISALVERWRRETNTFHMTVGEMTITLEDVALILGLGIDGEPVVGVTYATSNTLCEKLLGKAPSAEHASGGMVKLSWLRSSFSNCPEDASIEVMLQHTRAYILYLMGSTIFSTTTGNKVPVMYLQFLEDFDTIGNYAWGAAALSYLYRALGNASLKGQSNICGSLTLLQCWSCEHLKVGRPEFVEAGDYFPLALRWKRKSNSQLHDLAHYRHALDTLHISDVSFVPYLHVNASIIPENIRCKLALGRSKTMLICFDKAERHLPDRCLRQFGMLQSIPAFVKPWVRKTRGGGDNINLVDKMQLEIKEWATREQHIVEGDEHVDESEYMAWYMNITRKFIGRASPLPSDIIKMCETIKEICQLTDIMSTEGLDSLQFESMMKIRQLAHGYSDSQDEGASLTSIPQMELGERVSSPTHAGLTENELVREGELGLLIDVENEEKEEGREIEGENEEQIEEVTEIENGDQAAETRLHDEQSGVLMEIEIEEALDGVERVAVIEEQVNATSSGRKDQQVEVDNLDKAQTGNAESELVWEGESRLATTTENEEEQEEMGLSSGNEQQNNTIPSIQNVEQVNGLTLKNIESKPAAEGQLGLPIEIGSGNGAIGWEGLVKNEEQVQVADSATNASQSPCGISLTWPSSGTLSLEWIQDLMSAFERSSWNMPPSKFASIFPVSLLDRLIDTASNILHKEPNCLRVHCSGEHSRVMVVGDIHGQLHDLMSILREAGCPAENRYYVFNGDYVDRGAWGVETFLLLLAWKVLLPHRVYLLRGNHESRYCTTVYGFKVEVMMKYGDQGAHVYDKFLNCFEVLPLAAVIAENVYTAHGGLFRRKPVSSSKRSRRKKKRKLDSNSNGSFLSLGTLEELSEVRRFVLDPPSKGLNLIPGDIMWSDPSMSSGLSVNKKRGIGLLWGPDCTQEFLQSSHLKLIIRSHEGPDAREIRPGLAGMGEGYTIDHVVESGKLITLFSAPDYPQFQAKEERYNNKGAYVILEPPDFHNPVFRSFSAAERPKVNPYYDYQDTALEDENFEYDSIRMRTSIEATSSDQQSHNSGSVSAVRPEEQKTPQLPSWSILLPDNTGCIRPVKVEEATEVEGLPLDPSIQQVCREDLESSFRLIAGLKVMLQKAHMKIHDLTICNEQGKAREHELMNRITQIELAHVASSAGAATKSAKERMSSTQATPAEDEKEDIMEDTEEPESMPKTEVLTPTVPTEPPIQKRTRSKRVRQN